VKGSQKAGTHLAVGLACLVGLALGHSASGAELVIEQVTVVAPQHAAAQPKQYVLIRDGRIVSVGSKPVSAAAGAVRIDGRGKFLTPGLTDSHVHVGDVPGFPGGAEADPAMSAIRDAYIRQQPRSYLYYGVTQVFNLLSAPESAAAFEAQPQHPDLYSCNAPVVLDGYPSVFIEDKAVRYRTWPEYIYEPANAANHPLPAGADAAQHTPEAIIGRLATNGVRCIKIFIEDGFGPANDWPIMSKETLQRVRAETRKRGLLLIAHANAIDMQRIAAVAQVDVIAHGLWNWNEYSTDQGVPPAIAAHLREIHAKKIGYQPTLRVIAGLADLFREDTLKDPAYAKVVPPSLLAWYATPAGQWFKDDMRKSLGGVPDLKAMHTYMVIGSYGMRATKYLSGLGHPLLLGSDTPSAPTFGAQPGDTYSLTQEFHSWPAWA